MWREPIVALLLIASLACDSAQPNQPDVASKTLARLAQQAKAEGKRSITTGVVFERVSGTLRDVFRKSSIVVTMPTGEPRVRVVGDSIVTLQDFRVERWLHRIPASASDCYPPWPGVADDESLVTTRLAKGTVVVDDVSITETTLGPINFSKGQRYLLLVHDCAGRRIEIAYLFDSLFKVSDDGEILADGANTPPVPFVSEIIESKTVSALESLLKSLSAASN